MQQTTASSLVGIPAFVTQVKSALSEVEVSIPRVKSARSDDARNTLFELATAAALRRAGFDVFSAAFRLIHFAARS